MDEIASLKKIISDIKVPNTVCQNTDRDTFVLVLVNRGWRFFKDQYSDHKALELPGSKNIIQLFGKVTMKDVTWAADAEGCDRNDILIDMILANQTSNNDSTNSGDAA